MTDGNKVFAFGKVVKQPFKPPTKSQTFPGMPAIAILGIFFGGSLAPFFGIFIPSLTTPYPRWWAFFFLFSQSFILFALPRKIVVGPDGAGDATYSCYNIFGSLCGPQLRLSFVDSIELVKGCCGSLKMKTTFTETAYQQMRTEKGCAKCCVKKTFVSKSPLPHEAMIFFLGLDADFATSPSVGATTV